MESANVTANPEIAQDDELLEFLSGQIAAMVHEVQPAADIVRDVIEGAEPVLKGATKWVR